MSGIKLQLTGWKAIAAIVIVVAIVGYRYTAVRTTLETGGADDLRFWLLAEYQRQGLPGLDQALESGDMQAAEEQARQLIANSRIQFAKMSARGAPDDLVVRVRIRVDGAVGVLSESVLEIAPRRQGDDGRSRRRAFKGDRVLA